MWRPTTRNGGENRCGDRQRETAGTGAPPAAFNLGLCRLRGILSPPVAHGYAAGALFFCAGDNPCSDSQIHPLKSGITAVLGLFLGKILQRLPSLTPEITNRCTQVVVSGQSLQRFPNSPHEIQNHCTQEGVNGHNLAAIPKFTPCNPESLQPWGSGVLQVEPFSFAAAKNGIGRGPRCRYDHCRRNYSPLQQQKFESVAKHRSRKRPQ